MSATVFDGWLGTRRDRITASLVLLWFAVLNGLVLLGYEGAPTLLATSAGLLAGTLLAYPSASALRQRIARLFGAWRRAAASILALALVLAIVIPASYVLGSPLLLSEEGGPSGALVYGLALGFGLAMQQRLAAPPRSTPEEDREATRAGVRSLLVVGGAVAGLFSLTFTVYVAVEYVVGPAIRVLAP